MATGRSSETTTDWPKDSPRYQKVSTISFDLRQGLRKVLAERGLCYHKMERISNVNLLLSTF